MRSSESSAVCLGFAVAVLLSQDLVMPLHGLFVKALALRNRYKKYRVFCLAFRISAFCLTVALQPTQRLAVTQHVFKNSLDVLVVVARTMPCMGFKVFAGAGMHACLTKPQGQDMACGERAMLPVQLLHNVCLVIKGALHGETALSRLYSKSCHEYADCYT